MRKIQQLGRRTFLLNAGKGMFALWSEATMGLGRRGLAVAFGGSGLLTACTQPLLLAPEVETVSDLDPVTYARIFTQFVNSYVLIRGDEAAIVDTGIAGTGARFAEVLQEAGLGWDAVNHLILTHYHGDHIGAMGEVIEAAAHAKVYAGAEDISQINTSSTLEAVSDGDKVFGLQIVATPGHTPGHISVLDPVGSLLVAGDAFNNGNGILSGPNPQFTPDMPTAIESVRKLAALNFETALVGHGEPIEEGASAALAALVETL